MWKFFKFLNLMILTDIRFHNTDSVKIFLHNIVQFIVSFETFQILDVHVS